MDDNRHENIKTVNLKLIVIIFLALAIITLSTKYYGSADIADYADSAKYFASEYNAKIRNTHSYLFGFVHSPIVGLTESFMIFKIINLIVIAIIIYSVYFLSNKNKKALWLMLISPIVWFIAPWITPIIISSLFLLWAFYFIDKYNVKEELKYLFCSGAFIGLGWAFWDTILFFGAILSIIFMFNKKLNHCLILIISIIIGLIPRFILDQFLFGFPFYTIMKSFFAAITFIFLGGIYSRPNVINGIFEYVQVLLIIPIYFWILYKKRFISENKKTMVFLSLSLILILFDPQLRYLFSIAPIMILLISKNIKFYQFRRQIIFSIIIIILVIVLYIIQITHSMTKENEWIDYGNILSNKISIQKEFPIEIIERDLLIIVEKYPNEIFLVGPNPDNYHTLADVYWGFEVKEFVSIQDFELYRNNETILLSKTFKPTPKIRDRRQIWISGGISRNENDDTDYDSIIYMINFGDNPIVKGFEKIESYEVLSLWRKK